jgi:hypothetical protein
VVGDSQWDLIRARIAWPRRYTEAGRLPGRYYLLGSLRNEIRPSRRFEKRADVDVPP